jgi:hypothetical protein
LTKLTARVVVDSVTCRAGAKFEIVFNKPASVLKKRHKNYFALQRLPRFGRRNKLAKSPVRLHYRLTVFKYLNFVLANVFDA